MILSEKSVSHIMTNNDFRQMPKTPYIKEVGGYVS